MDYRLFLSLFGVASLSAAFADDPILVTLPEGQIRGKELLSAKDKVYYAFQDIPFAAPPVGELRFQSPVAPTPWEGILNTTENKKMCHQTVGFVPAGMIETEDCLYLNVYTPIKPGDSSQTPLPVLVWIHGGGYMSGMGSIRMYNPRLFIDYDVIIVTMNYRLGILGFLSTEDGVIPGNIGLRDQQFAMQWVKKNINLFGGDPEKITISGESAGASSAGLHLHSTKNKGLFRGAILQSGSSLCQWTHQNYARFYAFELGRNLVSNFTSDDSKELLALLQSIPATAIYNNTVTEASGKETGAMEGDGVIWVPIIEDPNLEEAFLTGPFDEDIKTGNIVQVPTLLGYNSEEAIFYLYQDSSFPENVAKYLDLSDYNLIRHKFNMTTANKSIAGNRLKQVYTSGKFEDDLAAAVKFYSDTLFSTPVIRHAKLQSNYTDVYLYQFSYKGKLAGLMDVEIPGAKGVGHSEDLTYLWETFYGVPVTQGDPEDLVARERLLTVWSNFVKYLNPIPEKDVSLGNVTWEKVTPNNLVYMNFNNTLEMQKNPREYVKWENIIEPLAIPPVINY